MKLDSDHFFYFLNLNCTPGTAFLPETKIFSGMKNDCLYHAMKCRIDVIESKGPSKKPNSALIC